MRRERQKESKSGPLTKGQCGPKSQETREAKMAELYSIRLRKGIKSPDAGRERFRRGGMVKSAGESHRH